MGGVDTRGLALLPFPRFSGSILLGQTKLIYCCTDSLVRFLAFQKKNFHAHAQMTTPYREAVTFATWSSKDD